jgi:hypothetical protein
VIPHRTLFALSAAGLLAAVAAAQLDAAQQPDDRTPAKPARTTPPPALPDIDRAAERTEDVEVLRRILNKSLGLPDKVTVNPNLVPYNPGGFGGGGISGFGGGIQGFGGGISGFGGQPGGIGGIGGFSGHPQPGFIPANPNTGFNQPQLSTIYVAASPASQVGPFDGVYLPGHGIVYTLRVPEHVGIVLDPPSKAFGLAAMCLKCHATEPVSRAELEPPADKAKPPTEWDRTREELRGAARPAERPKAPGKVSRQQICEPGNLTERVVTKLFQNARHVRHLPEGEHVTVVVTFDGAVGSARHRTVIDLSPSTNIGAEGQTKGPAGKAGFTPEESQKLTLGDLHLKQNKPKEAAEVYRQALARYKDAIQQIVPPAGLTAAQQTELAGELQKGVRDAYAKYAQALLAAGEVDRANSALDMARKFKVELASTTAAPAREKEVPVPAKLVISVAKADVDKAADDPAAFKKAVKVETVGFPPADRKKP